MKTMNKVSLFYLLILLLSMYLDRVGYVQAQKHISSTSSTSSEMMPRIVHSGTFDPLIPIFSGVTSLQIKGQEVYCQENVKPRKRTLEAQDRRVLCCANRRCHTLGSPTGAHHRY